MPWLLEMHWKEDRVVGGALEAYVVVVERFFLVSALHRVLVCVSFSVSYKNPSSFRVLSRYSEIFTRSSQVLPLSIVAQLYLENLG